VGIYEKYGSANEMLYTCNAIESILGLDVREAYKETFGLRNIGEPQGNEQRLWNARNAQDLRVLMLSFAAAMAETGDL
jgi:hypothetical protein